MMKLEIDIIEDLELRKALNLSTRPIHVTLEKLSEERRRRERGSPMATHGEEKEAGGERGRFWRKDSSRKP